MQRERPSCRNSSVSSGSHGEIDHPVVSILLSRVSLQFQGQFVPSFFEASSQDCGSRWEGCNRSSCSQRPHPVGDSLSVNSLEDAAQNVSIALAFFNDCIIVVWYPLLFSFASAVLTSLIKIIL